MGSRKTNERRRMIAKQITTIRALCATVYAALFIVSGLLTLGLWQSAASEHMSATTAQAIGGCLHIALYLFAAAARGLPLEPDIKKGTWCLVAILGLASIAATVGHLESGTRTNNTQAHQAQIELEQANQITQLRIDNAATYSGVRRSTDSETKLDQLQAKADERAKLLNTIQQAGAINHLISLASNTLGTDADRTRFALFLVLAILLDTCGIWSALLLFQPVQLQNPHRTDGTEPEQEVVPLIEQARTAVTTGALGDNPSVTKMQRALGTGRGQASGLLQQLETEGLVSKNKQGHYQRAEIEQ
jgi:hypothetical protein